MSAIRLRAGLAWLALATVAPAQETPSGFAAAAATFAEAERPVDALAEGVRRAPTDAWLQHHYGLALAEARWVERAAQALRHAIELDPEQAWHRQALAELLERRGLTAASVRVFREAARRESRPDVHAWLVGKADEAERLVAREASSLARLQGFAGVGVLILLAGLIVLARPVRA